MARQKKQLGSTAVSATVHELIKAIESGAMAVEQSTYYAERDAKYSALSVDRTSLYQYVADLERRLGIPQTVTIRF